MRAHSTAFTLQLHVKRALFRFRALFCCDLTGPLAAGLHAIEHLGMHHIHLRLARVCHRSASQCTMYAITVLRHPPSRAAGLRRV